MNQHTSIGTVGHTPVPNPNIDLQYRDDLKNRLAAIAALIVSATLTFAWVGVLVYVLLMFYF
jgi:hypothetical protein